MHVITSDAFREPVINPIDFTVQAGGDSIWGSDRFKDFAGQSMIVEYEDEAFQTEPIEQQHFGQFYRVPCREKASQDESDQREINECWVQTDDPLTRDQAQQVL